MVYPDWLMALWNKPLACGAIRSDKTLCPPADSPNIVTFDESPPKRIIFLFTHSSALIISSVPKFDVLSSPFCLFCIDGWVNQPKGPNL